MDFLFHTSYYTNGSVANPIICIVEYCRLWESYVARMFIWCFNYTDDSLLFIIAAQSERELYIAMSIQHLTANDEYDLRLLAI